MSEHYVPFSAFWLPRGFCYQRHLAHRRKREQWMVPRMWCLPGTRGVSPGPHLFCCWSTAQPQWYLLFDVAELRSVLAAPSCKRVQHHPVNGMNRLRVMCKPSQLYWSGGLVTWSHSLKQTLHLREFFNRSSKKVFWDDQERTGNAPWLKIWPPVSPERCQLITWCFDASVQVLEAAEMTFLPFASF